MRRFWLIIGAVILTISFGFGMLPRATSYTYEPPIVVVLARYSLLGSLVGVIWAIFFRKQLESFRLSIFSLFALVTMEAVLLTAARIMNPH